MKKTILLYLFFFSIKATFSQDGFHFLNQNKERVRVRFKLINNLVVLPLELNGKKLSFILDSGVGKTILFNISKNDSIGLNNVETVELKGLGNGKSVEALLSKNNRAAVESIVNEDETIYVILRDYFDLSGKMGVTIHGIIGYNILRNFIVKINYKKRIIDFYRNKEFKFKKCRRCEVFPIYLHRKKPYIKTKVQLDTIGDKQLNVNLLVDSGGSDAIWLFENKKKGIITPKRYFNDLLGEGLSGSIYGNRSRIPRLKLGSFEITEPTVSFLDSISTQNAMNYRDRNGSLGAGILNKFIVWFDYPNRRMMLQKNGSFSSGFNYNMSGIDVVYNGKQLVREEQAKAYTDSYGQSINSNNSINIITSYTYKFKPSFRVSDVVKNSPASLAGVQKNDIIIKINGNSAHEYKLSDIISVFQERHNKKISLVVVRNGILKKIKFRLKKRI